jgi:hypothetical protein
MKRIILPAILILAAVSAARAQSTYPSAVDNSSSLIRATDFKFSFLTAPATSESISLVLASTSGLPASGVLQIDSELMFYSVSDATHVAVVRGYSSTSAKAHAANATVRFPISAAHVNSLDDAVIAVETKLGAGSSSASTAATGSVLTKKSDGTTGWAASVGGGSSGGATALVDGTDLTTAATVTASHALKVDGSGATQPVSVASLPLPAGAATSAGQTVGNTSLSSIDAKTPTLGQASAAASVPVVLPAAQLATLTPPSSVGVNNFPATQAVSVAALPLPAGASTEATLSALNGKVTAVNTGAVVVSSSALPTGASTEATLALIKAKTDNLDVLLSTRTKPADAQTVSGTVTANAGTGTMAVSAASLPLPTGASTSARQDTGNTSLASVDAKTPALGQALAASSVPVVLTAAQLATLTPVSTVAVSNFPATQPVSGTVSVSNTAFTANAGTNLNTSALALDATLTGGAQRTKLTDGTNNAAVKAASTAALAADPALVVAVSPNNSVAVTGAFFQATQPVSVAATLVTKPDTVANQTSPQVATLGNTAGKTNVLKTGTLASSATTADQVVLTYTVTAGKTLFLQTWDVSMGLTTPGTTAIGGSCSLESPAGTKLDTNVFRSVGHQTYISQNYAEPVGIPSGTVVRFVCTPSAVTATTWAASLAGYER